MRSELGRLRGAVGRSIPGTVLGLIVLASPLLASAQQYLFNRLDVTIGSNPRGTASADFNNDGRPDLAIVNEASNTVSILLGLPAGTFSAATNYATGTGPYAVTAADFNNDGNQDLAIVNVFDATVSLLLGNGNGTFTTKSVAGVGSLPLAMAVGDFNKDGKLDLAVANLAGNSVSVLFGIGDGTFQNQVVYSGPPSFSEPRAIVAGNFNNDGNLDLVIANNSSNNLSIMLGSSNGMFTIQSVQPATGTQPFAIAFADFNGDGVADLAVANAFSEGSGDTVSVMMGNGNGTFQSQVVWNVGNAPNAIWAGSLYAGSPPSIVTSNGGDNTISVLTNPNGNGNFQAHQDYATGQYPYGITSADFNGDGVPDFAISNTTSNSATILIGDGDGTFTERKVTTAGSEPEGVAVGDLNGDGKLDAAVADFASSSVLVLLGNGDGTFTNGPTLSTGPASGPSGVVIGDFNGDGILDIATANAGDSMVSLMLGTGGGNFASHLDFPAGAAPTGLATADVNKDGHLDLITANTGSSSSPGSTISVLLGTGNGTFQTHQDYGVGAMPVAVAVADFNNDGSPDLAVANSLGNTVSVLLGNGTGAFPTQTAYIVGYDPLGIAAGLVNSDANVDIVTANNGGGSVALLAGNGDGTFQKHANFTVPGANNIALGNFNGDSFLDVVATSSAGVASVLLGNGTGAFQQPVSFGLGVKPFAVATGTFNSAGGTGFIATSFGSNSVGTFVNLPVISLYPPSFNFGTVGVGQMSSKTLTITNPSATMLNVSGFSTTGDYSEAGNCVTGLMPGASCTQTITFSPTQGGTRNGTATITDNAPTGMQMIPLTGSGGGPQVSFNPPGPINFGNVPVNTSSTPQNVTMTNTGTGTLTITSIAATTNYSEMNTCGSSLPPNGNCTITITFTPTTTGTINGSINVTDNAPGSPQMLATTGVGTQPGATLSPSSHDFGNSLINTTTPTFTFTLTNNGNATLTGITPTVSGPFLLMNKCSTTLAPNSSCNLLVSFKPTGVGPASGTLSVTDNAPNSPQTSSLSGMGTVVLLSPTSLNFGTVMVGHSSTPMSVTLTNKGTGQSLSITGIAIGGLNMNDFSQTNNCPASLGSQASCMIMVTFTPQATGSRSASLQVSDNGGGSPQTVSLSGTGQ